MQYFVDYSIQYVLFVIKYNLKNFIFKINFGCILIFYSKKLTNFNYRNLIVKIFKNYF